ncbi:RING-type E3 ubiquitin transferase [Sarracenia purpurea var. burkii]
MENSKGDSDGTKNTDPATTDQNPNNSAILVEEQEEQGSNIVGNQIRQSTRTPFTNLNQVDADLALARTLQEQERAYMMFRMNGDGSDYGSWEGGSYIHEDDEDFDDPSGDEYDGTDVEDEEDDGVEDEDAFDVHAHAEAEEDNNTSVGIELDPASFPNDEAYARALQDAEDREMAARLLALAGINDLTAEDAVDSEDHGVNSQDTWEEVDPDELSYEELLALGEVVGTESRGLSADTIASLPSVNYKAQSSQHGSNDSCVICRVDYEDGDTLTLLSCKHSYHSECINNWLRINKVCPVCSSEVSTSGSS